MARVLPKSTVFIQVAVALLIAATGLFALYTQLPIERFFRDTSTVGNVPFHAGALSTIGLFFWCAAAAACLLTAAVLAHVPRQGAQRRFVLGAGLLSTVLLFDDAFLFHEVVAPHHMGIPADLVVGSYGVVLVLLFWHSRSVIAESPYGMLLLAIVWFGLSVGMDVLKDQQVVAYFGTPEWTSTHSLLEDGAKLFGIANWCAYFLWTCHVVLVQRTPERRLRLAGDRSAAGSRRERSTEGGLVSTEPA